MKVLEEPLKELEQRSDILDILVRIITKISTVVDVLIWGAETCIRL